MTSEDKTIKELEDAVRELEEPKQKATRREKDTREKLFCISETNHFYITGTDEEIENWKEDGYNVYGRWGYDSTEMDVHEMGPLNEDGTHRYNLISVGGSL